MHGDASERGEKACRGVRGAQPLGSDYDARVTVERRHDITRLEGFSDAVRHGRQRRALEASLAGGDAPAVERT